MTRSVNFEQLGIIGLTAEQFEKLKNEYDVFIRCGSKSEIIIECCYEDDVLKNVAEIMGVEIDDIRDNYIVCYVE
ncbi:hypothetical protein A3715_15245 [Oleiphilus sp. HI0009]|nr:hypothetical protein A3715_15245 [Oleiphilus sp. HI0009]